MRAEAIKCIFFGKPERNGPLMRPSYRKFEVVLQNLANPSDIILLEKSTDDKLVKNLSPLYGYRRLITVSTLTRQLLILQETVIIQRNLKRVNFLALAAKYPPIMQSAQWRELRERVQ